MIHYLDNSATTMVLPEAAEAAVHMMRETFGNPSSLHSMGIDAARVLKESRETAASALGCAPAELTFISGGTEGINTAILGAARKNRHFGRHIVTTAIEHAATLQACKRLESEGFEVTYIQPDGAGRIQVDDVTAALREDTILVTVMLVNNEVGTCIPVDGGALIGF